LTGVSSSKRCCTSTRCIVLLERLTLHRTSVRLLHALTCLRRWRSRTQGAVQTRQGQRSSFRCRTI
jgi:hypothetical protein